MTLQPVHLKQIDPHACRWMSFVDGENLAIRGKEVLRAAGIPDQPTSAWHERDVFLWPPGLPVITPLPGLAGNVVLAPKAIRAHYYTSVRGDHDKVNSVRRRLKALGFDPEVFKNEAAGGAKAKGVDIALSKDMLSHAFRDNYDAAVLFAGDGDYVPLVDELKRLGRRVCVAFYADFGLSPELALHADSVCDLTRRLIHGFVSQTPPKQELGTHTAQCSACLKVSAFNRWIDVPGGPPIPPDWATHDLKGTSFVLCDACGPRIANAGPETDPLSRAMLRERRLLAAD